MNLINEIITTAIAEKYCLMPEDICFKKNKETKWLFRDIDKLYFLFQLNLKSNMRYCNRFLKLLN